MRKFLLISAAFLFVVLNALTILKSSKTVEAAVGTLNLNSVTGTSVIGGNSVQTFTRTTGTALNDWINIGDLTPSGTGVYANISLRFSGSGEVGFTEFNLKANAHTNDSTNWIELPANGGVNYTSTQTYAVDAKHDGWTLPIHLRIRKIGNAGNASTITVRIETNATFTASSTTGSNGAVDTGYLGSSLGWKFPVITTNFDSATDGLYILPGGNVGIGSTAPNGKLSLVNNVATGFLDNYSEYQMILYDSGSATTAYGLGVKGSTMVLNSNGGYSFDRTGNATSMVIDTSGNVGIGTTGPAQKLDVNGSIATGGTTRIDSSGNLSNIGTIGSGAITSSSTITGTTLNGTTGLNTGASAGTQRIDSSGNHVNAGNITFTAANPSITASSYTSMSGGLYVNGGNLTALNQARFRGGIANDTNATLTIAGGTSGYSSFSGNVGINTAAQSSYPLVVYKAADSSLIRMSADSGEWSGLNTDVGGTGWIAGQLGGNDFSFYTGPGPVPVKFVLASAVNDTLVVSGGKVGIRNTSPTSLLDLGTAGSLLGTLRLHGNTSGYTVIQPSAAAGSWTMTLPTGAGSSGQQLQTNGSGVTSWAAAGSLRSMKNIIGTMTPQEGLDTILDTPVYRFKYKPGKGTLDSKTEYVGVMADEAPWAVHYDGTIINPVNTLGYMVLGTQELNTKIEKQGKIIENQKQQINGMKETIDQNNVKLQKQLENQQKELDELKKEIEALKKK